MSTANAQTVEADVNNGVNVEALIGAREALEAAPAAAQFKWRASCKWQNGTHSVSTVEKFHGLGEEHTHKSSFRFEADHPEVFAAADLGATPSPSSIGSPQRLASQPLAVGVVQPAGRTSTRRYSVFEGKAPCVGSPSHPSVMMDECMP